MPQIDRHMPFFRLLDAARAPGCLLCRLISTHTRRYIESVLYESVNSPGFRDGWRAARGAADLIAGLPQDLSQLLRAAKRGKLRVEVEVLPLKHFGDRIDRAVSRLTIGIVTAALIIGTSIVMSMAGEGLMAGLSTYALLGFLGAVIGGVWLLLSIRRSNKD